MSRFSPERYWILDDNHHVVETDAGSFHRFFAEAKHLLFREKVASFDVFTYITGDYEDLSYWLDGTPLLFVTQVGYKGHPVQWLFEGANWSQQYSSWMDAKRGHESMVETVRAHVAKIGDLPTSKPGEEPIQS